MKVQTKEGTFTLGFQYQDDVETHAIIRNENKEVVTVGITKRYFKDNYDKEKARHASLQKALVQGWQGDKTVRRQFWEAYLNRKSK